ncbi:MAG: hypothetical protein AABY07_05675 [Nanoarchaeota archaeon]
MIPLEKELLDFIRKHDLVNYTLIAKHYKIKNTTVSDIIDALEKKKLVEVRKLGGSKIVRIKKND